jgi:ABC-type transport system substrate-binding protein
MFQESNLGLQLVPKHIWNTIPYDEMGAKANDWAISEPEKLFGAGPYKLQNFDSLNDIIHLTRNDYFDNWTGITPYFSDIYFEFYSNKDAAINALSLGNVDMVDSQFSLRLEDIPEEVKYEFIEGGSTQEMALNLIHPHFGTGEACPIAGPISAKYVRKAISHAVPREYICDELFQGIPEPSASVWPRISSVYNESLEPYEYNLDLALEYMRMAGYDVPPSPSIQVGITIPIFISIFSIIGTITYINKRKVCKN